MQAASDGGGRGSALEVRDEGANGLAGVEDSHRPRAHALTGTVGGE